MSDVSKVFPSGAVALQDVNVHIEPGEFVFVVGPSGAGKSTFTKMLFREVLPTTGNIFVNGIDILNLQDKEIPYSEIASIKKCAVGPIIPFVPTGIKVVMKDGTKHFLSVIGRAEIMAIIQKYMA